VNPPSSAPSERSTSKVARGQSQGVDDVAGFDSLMAEASGHCPSKVLDQTASRAVQGSQRSRAAEPRLGSRL
jgi:hypothetical protein